MATDKNKVSAYLDDLDFQLLGELAGNYRVSKSQIISRAIRAMPLHPNPESGVNTSSNTPSNAVTQVELPDNSTIESLVENKLESLFKGVSNGTVESEKEKELVELLSSVINSKVESLVESRINDAIESHQQLIKEFDGLESEALDKALIRLGFSKRISELEKLAKFDNSKKLKSELNSFRNEMRDDVKAWQWSLFNDLKALGIDWDNPYSDDFKAKIQQALLEMALQKPTIADKQADLPTTEETTASTDVFNTHLSHIEEGMTIEDEELSFTEFLDLTRKNQDIPPQTNPSSDKKDILQGEGVEDNKNVIEVGEATQRFTDREVQRILQQEKILKTSTQNITKWRKGQSNPRGLNKKILDHFKPDGDRWIRLPR